MKDKLRAYLDNLFADAPKTRKAFELREELLSNLNAKYDDMISMGHTEEEAYQAAIAGMGDVGELIDALKKGSVFSGAQNEGERKKSALFVSISVMLYILSVVPLFILQNEMGLIFMFVIAAIATGLIIYNAMSHPKYQRMDETVVEEFKEWHSSNSDKVRIRKSISSVLWPLVVITYLLVSFFTGQWGITWIIFLIGVAIENIIRAVFELKR